MIRRDDCEKLVQYVLQLARYDLSYDMSISVPALFKRHVLAAHAEQIFMSKKPAPALQSSFKEREQFQLGTLSHALNQRCARYKTCPTSRRFHRCSMRREANSPEEFKY
ncbi:hypothetical protein COOONC_15982, partial [Cooperia oncophora]